MESPLTGPPAVPSTNYWLTRFVILRLLGFIYAAAFLAAALQLLPLVGSHGLLPVGAFLERAGGYYGSRSAGFWHLPSLFWFGHSDRFLLAVAWTGFGLSLVVLAGCANAPLLAILWALYMSIVHIGQEWYGYGWESQLLETGFLAIFLSPWWDLRPFSRQEPPLPVIWLFRWLIFRIMLGSGLIKLRGDEVWRDLTALYYHFETQPLPNPLSRWFHFLPHGVLRAGVIFNFAAELAAPLLVFWPRAGRIAAGAVIISFQIVLILSGNLSFLNWLTILPALACFDDGVWLWIFPPLQPAWKAATAAPSRHLGMRRAAWAITALVAGLSLQPALNLVSSHQMMNTSFDPFEIVNTYGAFGSVGRERMNVVFEGTDSAVADEHAVWRPYRYQALPVDLDRRPPQIAPYQPRLDWAMWFAGMSDFRHYPWTLHLVWKLLHNDPGALGLFADNPFPRAPPRYVRATLYRYQFAPPGNPAGRWWNRTAVGPWLPALSVDNPNLTAFLQSAGWMP